MQYYTGEKAMSSHILFHFMNNQYCDRMTTQMRNILVAST